MRALFPSIRLSYQGEESNARRKQMEELGKALIRRTQQLLMSDFLDTWSWSWNSSM
jgi:hypothetical protein